MAETRSKALPLNEVQSDRAHHEGEPMQQGDSASLRSYTKAKLALAAELRSLRGLLKHRASRTRLEECDELMAKLAEDRFVLAVLGQFKRGKSTLMNAIIGRELLPVGALPLTSAITILRYGAKERLLITRAETGPMFPQVESIERLAEFVTEKQNPSNCKGVKEACVELPLSFLRRGVEFVDTPGVGSAIEANTTTTMNFLAECDAVVFVTSVDSPLTRIELDFLKSVGGLVGKIFFVVNKTDLLGPGELADTVAFLEQTICAQTRADAVKVFPVSARLGLLAKTNLDPIVALQSGLPALEDALVRFLAKEKSEALLASISVRAIRLLEQESVELTLRKRVQGMAASLAVERIAAVRTSWAELEVQRRQHFDRLRSLCMEKVRMALTPELHAFLWLQTATFPDEVERLLLPIAWWPALIPFHRCEEAATRRICRNAGEWLCREAERLNFVVRECQLDWERLLSTLTAIWNVAVEAFDLPDLAIQGLDLPPSCRLELECSSSFLADFGWKPHIPWPLGILPTSIVRKRLKKRMLENERPKLTEALEAVIIARATAILRRAFDSLWGKIEQKAREIEIRVMSALPNEQPIQSSRCMGLCPNTSEAAGLIHESLVKLHACILENHGLRRDDLGEEGGSPDAFAPPPNASEMKLAMEIGEPDLACDFRTRGCPACDHLARVAFQFFSQWQYAIAADEQAQTLFAAELGFCPLHTWQLEAISAPVGSALGFARLMEHVSKRLKGALKDPRNGRQVLDLVRNSTQCRVCRLLSEEEGNYLTRLLAFLGTPTGRQTYNLSQGLCLHHLGLSLVLAGNEEIARFLLTASAVRFEELAEDMESFGMKTEALRRQYHTDDERDAWLRALVHFVGSRAVCCPWNKDGEVGTWAKVLQEGLAAD